MIYTKFEPDKHFVPSFDSIAVREDGSFDFYITPDLRLNFFNIVMLTKNGPVYTDLIDIAERFEIIQETVPVFKSRIKLFNEHRVDRLKRYFTKYTNTLFLDSDYVQKLEDLFSVHYFTAEVSIEFDERPVNFKNLSLVDRERVSFQMALYGIIFEVDPRKYIEMVSTRRFRKLVSRQEFVEKGGVTSMSKAGLFARAAQGILILAAGSTVAIIGMSIAKQSIEALMGLDREIVLVKDEFSTQVEE